MALACGFRVGEAEGCSRPLTKLLTKLPEQVGDLSWSGLLANLLIMNDMFVQRGPLHFALQRARERLCRLARLLDSWLLPDAFQLTFQSLQRAGHGIGTEASEEWFPLLPNQRLRRLNLDRVSPGVGCGNRSHVIHAVEEDLAAGKSRSLCP